MDPAWLVPASLAFGALVGASIVSIVTLAARRGSRAVSVVTPTVPDGIDQVIDALESGGVVLDPSNNVIKASPGALAFGLVWNHTLVHPALESVWSLPADQYVRVLPAVRCVPFDPDPRL